MNESDFLHLTGWFRKYCATFHTGDSDYVRNIVLKEEHTWRVVANAVAIADASSLPPEDRRLAEIVALFHDVGRFPQYRDYGTFKDSDSLNHAALSARVLAGEGLLDLLPHEERLVVTRAVTLHNVYEIPQGLTERQQLHLRLVRDADKLDIWQVFLDYYAAAEDERASAVVLGFPDVPEITPAVAEQVARGEMVRLEAIRTLADFKLLQLSWVYDLNFDHTCRLFLEREIPRHYAANLPSIPEAEVVVAAVARHAGQRCGRGEPERRMSGYRRS